MIDDLETYPEQFHGAITRMMQAFDYSALEYTARPDPRALQAFLDHISATANPMPEARGFHIGPLWQSTIYALEGAVYAYVASPLMLLRPLVTRLDRDIQVLDAIEAENFRRFAMKSGQLVQLA